MWPHLEKGPLQLLTETHTHTHTHTTLKWRIKFYSANLLRTWAWEASSKIALRNCSEEVEEKPGYIVFGTTDKTKPPGSGVSKDYHLLRKNETSQVTDLALFFCLGRCKSLGSLKSLPWYTPKLSRASILFSPQPWIPSASMVRGSSWLGGRNTLWLLLWQVTFFVHKDVIMLRTSRWVHPGWEII